MAPIQQLYFTHCTYAGAALEQRTGPQGKLPCGFVPRAASVAGQSLRELAARVELLAHYRLPEDVPGPWRSQLSADTAPRRLAFLPDADGWQALAAAGYRTRDAVNHVGSAFAHILAQPAGSSGWTALDALQLWGARGWTWAEPAGLTHQLPTLPSLDALRDGSPPHLDDRVLESFLRTPEAGPFHDPGGVIPARWRGAPPAERQTLIEQALTAFLQLSQPLRERLLLVAEPELAALVFYAVLRLAPPGHRDVSFTTYVEPAYAQATLSATTFHNPQVTELPGASYEGRGLAFNTFTKLGSQLTTEGRRYVSVVLQLARQGGLAAVDGFVSRLTLDEPGWVAARVLDEQADGEAFRNPQQLAALRARFAATPLPQFVQFLQQQDAAFWKGYPASELMLRKRLIDLLEAVATFPAQQQSEVVGLLEHGTRLLPAADRPRVAAWREIVTELERRATAGSGRWSFGGERAPDLRQTLAQPMSRAFPKGAPLEWQAILTDLLLQWGLPAGPPATRSAIPGSVLFAGSIGIATTVILCLVQFTLPDHRAEPTVAAPVPPTAPPKPAPAPEAADPPADAPDSSTVPPVVEAVPATPSPHPTPLPAADRVKNRALQVRGNHPSLEFPDSEELPNLNADFSVETWLRWAAPPQEQRTLVLGTADVSAGWSLSALRAGPQSRELQFRFDAVQSETQILSVVSPATPFVPGRWYYVAVVCSEAGLSVVVDRQAGAAIPLKPMRSSPRPIHLFPPQRGWRPAEVRALRVTPSALARDPQSPPPETFVADAAPGAYVLDFQAGHWRDGLAAREDQWINLAPIPSEANSDSRGAAPLDAALAKPLGQLTRVATCFYELPKIPQSTDEASSLRSSAEPIPGSDGVESLDLHGLPAVNDWLQRQPDLGRGRDARVVARRQGRRLEIRLEEAGTNVLLAEAVIRDGGAGWSWCYLEGRFQELQTRLEHCVLEAIPADGPSRFIALHPACLLEDPLPLKASAEEFTASLEEADLPVRLAHETIVLGAGNLSAGAAVERYVLDSLLNDPPRFVRKVPALAALLKTESQLDDDQVASFTVEIREGRITARFTPSRAALAKRLQIAVESGPGKDQKFLAAQLEKISRFGRTSPRAQDGYATLVKWAGVKLPKLVDFRDSDGSIDKAGYEARLVEISNQAVTRARARVKELDSQIALLTAQNADRLKIIDEMLGSELRLSAVVYRIVDPEIQGREIQEGIAVPVVIYGSPFDTNNSK